MENKTNKINEWFEKHLNKVVAIGFFGQEDSQNVKLLDFNDNWFWIQFADGDKSIYNRNAIQGFTEGDEFKFNEYFEKFKEDPNFKGDSELSYTVIRRNKK